MYGGRLLRSIEVKSVHVWSKQGRGLRLRLHCSWKSVCAMADDEMTVSISDDDPVRELVSTLWVTFIDNERNGCPGDITKAKVYS